MMEEEAKQESTVCSGLIHLCLDAASRSSHSVEVWRRQVRTLERLPSHIANALFHRLLSRNLLHPSLLSAFKYNIEEIDLNGKNFVDAEWMAYIGSFCHLISLLIADCHRVTSGSLWPFAGHPTLRELNISRCSKVTDDGIRHLISIATLETLRISETGVTAAGVKLLYSLTRLSLLDLGGLPVTDAALLSLQPLKRLEYLDIWGSSVSNKGACALRAFSKLSFLNLAWTCVKQVPYLPSLVHLNTSNCTIDYIFEESDGDKPPLRKLIASGATLTDASQTFSNVGFGSLTMLDLSRTFLEKFNFLADMKSMRWLDLSFSKLGDESLQIIALIGDNLVELNLCNTGVSSTGLRFLAGRVPKLEVISLSYTHVDDEAISCLAAMPALKAIDLCKTNIKGFVMKVDELTPSLAGLRHLEYLERLNLEETRISDAALYPLQFIKELKHVYLKSNLLMDMTFYHLSLVQKIEKVGIRDAVFTNGGLESFAPPSTLIAMDLMGCWLLTAESILSFCERHPLVEVSHELIQDVSDTACNEASSQCKQWKHRRKLPGSQGSVYIDAANDQRIKYTREELIALNFGSLSLHDEQL